MQHLGFSVEDIHGQPTAHYSKVQDLRGLSGMGDFDISALPPVTTSLPADFSVPNITFQTMAPSGSFTDITGSDILNSSRATKPAASSIIGDITGGLNILDKLTQLGTKSYATVQAIQGNPYAAPYAAAGTAEPYLPALLPGTVPAGTFSASELVDFNTPWPYVIGGGLLLLLFATTMGRKGGK